MNIPNTILIDELGKAAINEGGPKFDRLAHEVFGEPDVITRRNAEDDAGDELQFTLRDDRFAQP